MFYQHHTSLSVGEHTNASKEEQAQKKMLGIYEVLWYLCWSTDRTDTKDFLKELAATGITMPKRIPYKWLHISWQLIWFNIKNDGSEMKLDSW